MRRRLSKKTMKLKVINTLTSQQDVIEVSQIQKRRDNTINIYTSDTLNLNYTKRFAQKRV